MALVTKRIYRISGDHSALNAQQIGVESSADADLGFKMYGGKDDAGDITKFLAKGKPGLMSTLNLSGGSTTGDAGLLKHDTLGDITGGQMTVSEFNTYISDGGFLWTRDVPNTRLEPLTASDKIVVGDGTAATPGVAHESNPTSGMYYGDVGHSINGIGLAHGGVGMIGVGVETGIAVMVCDPTQIGFEIRHQRDNETGTNEMKIHNVSTQSGVTSSLTIEASAVSAVSELVLNAQNLEFNADSAIDITAVLGTITIQAQGTTLGGVIIESDWFEFQNYTAYSPIPVWNSNTQWAAYEAEFGTEYPILQAIVDNTTSFGSLDDAYNVGHSVTVDDGAVGFTKPSGSTGAIFALTNLESSNGTELVNIYNDAAASTGYAIYLDGDAGDVDGVTAGQEWGHRIWTPDSITMGRNDSTYTSAFVSARRVDGTSLYESNALLRAEYSPTQTTYAEFAAKVWLDDAIPAGSANINCSGGIYLNAGVTVRFDDGYRSGSTWADTDGIRLFASSSEWDDLETLIGSEGSLVAGILAAASGGGASAPAGQILFGNSAGTGVTSEANLHWDETDNELSITASFVDLNESELRDIGSTNYNLYTITVDNATSVGVFTIDPDNNADQHASIVKDSYFDMTEPSNNASKIVVKIYNSDTSDHQVFVVSEFDGKINWVGSLTDGFVVPAGERVLLGIFFDQTNEWFIAGAACELVDYAGS